MSAGRRRAAAIAMAIAATGALGARAGLAADPTAPAAAAGTTVDRTAARFYSPETGGTAYPRFVSQRTLAFEARLVAMAENPEGLGDEYGERDVREALERHVTEEMLSNLGDRLIADSPPDKRPTAADLAGAERQVGEALVERVGGRARVDGAARIEQLDDAEVDAILRRSALSAWYIDRALSPILHPSDEQLRDVLRTSANPYRGRRFAQVRDALERWFVVERIRVAEAAFLQAARARVKIIVTN